MKKIALYLMFLWLGNNFLNAQHLNLAWQSQFFNSPYRIEAFADGWLVSGALHLGNYSPVGPYVARLGKGRILWERFGPGLVARRPNYLYTVLPLPGEKIAVFGSLGVCDFYGGSSFTVLDSSGEKTFFKPGPVVNPPEPPDFVHSLSEAESLVTGGFIGINVHLINTYNDTLGIRNSAFIYPDQLKHLTRSSDTVFWVSKVHPADQSWEIFPVLTRGHNFSIPPHWAKWEIGPEDAPVVDLAHYQGTVYALTESAIWNNRPPFQSPTKHPLPILGGRYFKLHRTTDAFYLLGETAHGRAGVLQLDTAFQFVGRWEYDLEWFKPVDFALRGDTIAILGQLHIPAAGRYLSSEMQQATGEANTLFAVKTFETDGISEAPRADVAITGIAWGGSFSPLYPLSCSDDCGLSKRISLTGFAISVRNNSPYTIRSLVLNTRYLSCHECGFICELQQGFSQEYEGLQLAPGSEITLAFEPALDFLYHVPDSGFELCFWVADADGHLEKDYANNFFCDYLPLDSTQMESRGRDWKVLPNPVSDILHIQFSETTPDDSKLLVYSVTGQPVLLSHLPPNSLSYHLPVDALPAGLYVLVWENQGERWVHRFVKRY